MRTYESCEMSREQTLPCHPNVPFSLSMDFSATTSELAVWFMSFP